MHSVKDGRCILAIMYVLRDNAAWTFSASITCNVRAAFPGWPIPTPVPACMGIPSVLKYM
jgi:hypothetical protein